MALILAITGGSGAGKTTIARALAAKLAARPDAPRVALIGEDDYYRCASTIPGFDAATHNFDVPAAKDDALLLAHVLRAKEGEGFDKPLYDLTTHRRRAETEHVAPAEIFIIEGIHLLAYPRLRAAFDLSIYIEADESLCLARRLKRDVETRGRTPHSVRAQFALNVRPMHEAHVAPQRAFADLVLISTAAGGLDEADTHAARIARALEQR